jgi:hypothetical protein
VNSKLFEIKKNEDRANLEVGDYDPEFKKDFSLVRKQQQIHPSSI